MAFPTGWPPRTAEGRRSIRFFKTATATAAFADRAYLFIDGTGANTFIPLPYVAPGSKAPVHIGRTPSGTGQDAHDVNPSAAPVDRVVVKAMIWANTLRIFNDDASVELEFSFDGTNVHGKIPPQSHIVYRNRYEAGIAVRGNGADFRIEAW